jgi:conjugative transfer signal peptidase TraF
MADSEHLAMNTRQKMASGRTRALQIGGAFLAGVGLAYLSNCRFVSTPSVPVGIYRATTAPVQRGSYVVVCLPKDLAAFGKARGYLGWGVCEGWVKPVIKTVGAVEGDVVQVESEGVTVNGHALANSKTLPRDSQGRMLSHVAWGTYHVKAGEVWLFATHARNSWDSRYYGSIFLDHIVSAAHPLWVVR